MVEEQTAIVIEDNRETIQIINDRSDYRGYIDSRIEAIRYLNRQTLENVLNIGRLLNQIREVAPKNSYHKVIKEHLGMNKQSAANYTNLANVWDNHPEWREQIQKLTLNAAYLLAKTTVDDEVRRIVLEISGEGDPLNREEIEDVNRVIREYRSIKIGDYLGEIDEDAIAYLYDCEIAEDASELKKLSKLSRKSQRVVAQYISEGKADNIKDALLVAKRKKNKEEDNSNSNSLFEEYRDKKEDIDVDEKLSKNKDQSKPEESYQQTVNVSYSSETEVQKLSNDDWESASKQIEQSSIDLMFVEAPLKHQFLIDGQYSRISSIAHHVLRPGGFLLTTVGHKSSMYIGEELAPIEPLHLLVLRRQPGNSRSIVGINITCASVIIAMAYKKPFKAPKTMTVDLQTVDDSIEGFDEVESGLEKGIGRFFNSLLRPNSNVFHLVCDKENFKLEHSIEDISKELEVNRLTQMI